VTPEMRKPPPDNAKGALNRRRLSSVNGGLVDRIGETPTRAAIQFNRVIAGDASPVIQASKKPPPRNANGGGFHHRLVAWRHPCPELPANTISPFLLGATKTSLPSLQSFTPLTPIGRRLGDRD
jgi:hypothetical protein